MFFISETEGLPPSRRVLITEVVIADSLQNAKFQLPYQKENFMNSVSNCSEIE
jgi:hypothetical protein